MNRALVMALALVASTVAAAQPLQEGTWGGTLSRFNANNPRPQRQKFALEIKKGADPHWAWRPGSGETWMATVIHQQGRSQAMDLRLDADALSFAYRREDSLMTCRLTRQTDGTFEGDCVGDANASLFRLSLTAPKPATK
jgi:hypothetical protein